MRFPQTLPDIRDEMQKVNLKFLMLLDPEIPRDFAVMSKISNRLAELTGALTEAIVDSTRI